MKEMGLNQVQLAEKCKCAPRNCEWQKIYFSTICFRVRTGSRNNSGDVGTYAGGV
jgi:hypothetical protein